MKTTNEGRRKVMEENKNAALVTPELLVWARKKAGLTITEAVVPEFAEKLSEWEEGKSKPTIAQAQKLAEIYKVPFAAFFLPEPPKEPGKVTLREIIKFAEEAEGDSDYEQTVAFCQVIKDLKQLEERIEETKNEERGPNFLARATVNEVIDEILGKKH